MKSSFAILTAASLPLLLSAPRASAGEVPFNVPVTASAQQARELLGRAAYALDAEVSARARADSDVRLSNLWLYPTNDVDTVFAHYTLTATDRASAGHSSAQHLAILTLRGNRIVSQQDLTAATAEGERTGEEVAARAPDARNWSATIGNGHTSNSSHLALVPSEAAPASPHWSASIGTGQAVQDSAHAPSTSVAAPALAGAHWTSKIGTARASDADADITKRRI